MSLKLLHCYVTVASFPRVSGDEPAVLGRYGSVCWFSPRERG